MPLAYTIYPAGNNTVTIDFGNTIDAGINKKIIALFDLLRLQKNYLITDIIPAYSSLSVVYDFMLVKQCSAPGAAFSYMKDILEQAIETLPLQTNVTQRNIKIPVCYHADFAIDLAVLANDKNMSTDDIIKAHCARAYRVYMIGFLPGFAYMGEVDESLVTSRKQKPVATKAGSVGIAGKQTGIYPLDSPGGWHIIGRTPVAIFDLQEEHPVYFNPGDEVSFYSISKDEFENYQGGHT